jgi:DNA repair exonuclease SbcCD ATPase subunit
MLQLRRLLNEELANLPTLREKLNALFELQQEHLALQRLREKIARGSGQPTNEQLRQFHDLLAREEALSSRSAALVTSFQRDRARLLDEIAARRQAIEDRLEELRNKAPAELSPKASEELRNLYRTRRMYAHITERLNQLDEIGSSTDWQNRLLRGLWSPEEIDPRLVEQARERLRQLEHEQQELRERLDDLREQLEDLREILSAAIPPPTSPQEPRELSDFKRPPRQQQPPQPAQQRSRRQGTLSGPQSPEPPALGSPPRDGAPAEAHPPRP